MAEEVSSDKVLREESIYYSQDMFDEYNQFAIDPDRIDMMDEIDIPIFREGRFKHWLYGVVDNTPEFLEKIVQNFERGVNPQKISFNVDHLNFVGDHASYGWIENEPGKLYIRELSFDTPTGVKRKKFLIAKCKPTKKGREALKNKEFRYTSSEIANDFTTNELEPVYNENGEITGEAVVKYGPALVGVALTNYPFIPYLPSIFSDKRPADGVVDFGDTKLMVSERNVSEGDGVIFSVKYDNVPTRSSTGAAVEEPFRASTSPARTEEAQGNERFTKGSKEPQTGKEYKMDELLKGLAKFSDTKERIGYLRGQLGGEHSSYAKTLLEAEERALAAESQYNSIAEQAAAKEQQVMELNKQLAAQRLETARARRQSYSAQVDSLCDKLSQNMPPAVVEEARSIFSGLNSEDALRKFNNVDGDSEGADIFEIVTRLFSKIPEDMHFSTGSELDSGGDVQVSDGISDEPADSDVPAKIVAFAERYGMRVEDVDQSWYSKLDKLDDNGNIVAG